MRILLKRQNLLLLNVNSNNRSCFRRCVYNLTGKWDGILSIELKKNIEEYWGETARNAHKNHRKDAKGNKYVLSMFPYPSGRLHLGHFRIYTISDAMAKFYSLSGYNVIHPMGWDSFGLPAENAAFEKGIPPEEWTESNIAIMKEQFSTLGIGFDWDREIKTSSKIYYKWTQALFLKLFEEELAYRKEAVVNWDPVDQTVLADEQVDENGRSWRSGAVVEKKRLKQWFIATTKYSKSLWEGLEDPALNHWKDIIKMQKHWIGEPNGYRFSLTVMNNEYEELSNKLEIYVDKPKYFNGITFIVVSPNHHLNQEIYHKKDFGDGDILTNIEAVHTESEDLIPIYISSNIECTPATESRVGIPGHNDIDYAFAQKHNLGVTTVRFNIEEQERLEKTIGGYPTKSQENKEGIAHRHVLLSACDKGDGGYEAGSKLRDWLVSRQRYWGTPIPIIHCQACGEVPVSELDLPVELPKVYDIDLKKSSSALSVLDSWKNVECPKCGKPATRETDTLDTFFDSSWYYLRYLNANDYHQLVSKEEAEKFMPVDLYIGGKEHATLHLFYARFMSHFCHEMKITNCKEPFTNLLVQGMVKSKTFQVKKSGKYLPVEDVEFRAGEKPAEKGTGDEVMWSYQKMSKSKFNGVDPQDAVNKDSIDFVRAIMLSSHNPSSEKQWPPDNVSGVATFEKKLWSLVRNFVSTKLNSKTKELKLNNEKVKKFEENLFDVRNYYLKSITHNFLRTYQINLCMAKMMGMLGGINNVPMEMALQSDQLERTLATLLIVISPIMPHLTCELWSRMASVCNNNEEFDWSKNVLQQNWPEVDSDYRLDVVIMMNHKNIGCIKLAKSEVEEMTVQNARSIILRHPQIQDMIGTREIEKCTFEYQKNYKATFTMHIPKVTKEDNQKKETDEKL